METAVEQIEKVESNLEGVTNKVVKKTNTKEELISNIREWIKIDNDLKK